MKKFRVLLLNEPRKKMLNNFSPELEIDSVLGIGRCLFISMMGWSDTSLWR